MDDFISRQAAIDALVGMNGKRDDDGYVMIYRCDACDNIYNLPSVQPERWIPVTERLPENERMVLCTVQSGEHFCVIPCIFIQKTKRWLPKMHGNHDNVIAWRELSAPYRLKHES